MSASRAGFLRSRRGLAALAACLLILFFFRPGVYRFRNRISTTIGNALGRRVALDDVHLRLLPRPGFDLEGLVIYDDPGFSEEPMIRAPEVSAAIRFRSLLRGRLEIATLSASEPSINLVRNKEGRWNLASLLERNAQIPAAPTAKSAYEHRPAFPYLEASNARINFKLGQTKKSYALVDAEVALWQDSENSWGARMQAQPVRTDFNLTDTGVLQIAAIWQRASSLPSTPLQINLRWKNGQLGQMTKLLSGKDRGWRGAVDFSANLSGTPEALRIRNAIAVDGFHRYDIAASESVRLAAECSAQSHAMSLALETVLCESPVNGGTLRLRGNWAWTTEPVYDLTFNAEDLPLSSFVRLLRQSKKQVPADLNAAGALNAEFHLTRGGNRSQAKSAPDRLRNWPRTWAGKGALTNVRLVFSAGNSNPQEIVIRSIPLSLGVADFVEVSPKDKPRQPRTIAARAARNDEELRLRVGPFPLAIDASPPVEAGGWLSARGYRLFLRGDMTLKDLFQMEGFLGLTVLQPAAEGTAKLDVSMSGPWQGFAPAVTSGTAKLRDVHAEIRGLNPTLKIDSANLTLTPDTVLLEKISARTGNTRWSGWVEALRHCSLPGTSPAVSSAGLPNCEFRFDLAADEFSSRDLADWLAPHSQERPWYRILNSTSTEDSRLADPPTHAIRAYGTLRVGRFLFKKLPVTEIVTRLEIDRGKITLNDLRAQLLGGTHQGDWTLDFSNHAGASQSIAYHGAGILRNASLSQSSALMNDEWITGEADGKFEIEGAANDLHELWAHSNGSLRVVMRNGSLPHVEIPGSRAPLSVYRFAAQLRLQKNVWQLLPGRLESHDGIYRVSGTVSSTGNLDVVLQRGDEQSWTLAGTLAKPHFLAPPETEAQRTEADTNTVKP